MRYKDVLNKQRKVTKDILTNIEEIFTKYNITPDEYHKMRMVIKTRIWGFSNIWHRFFVTVVDAKFEKGINEEGEKPETHLK